MLHQAQQGGAGRDQPAPCLLLGQSVKARVQRGPVLVQEELELDALRLVDDVVHGVGVGGHTQTLASRWDAAVDVARQGETASAGQSATLPSCRRPTSLHASYASPIAAA